MRVYHRPGAGRPVRVLWALEEAGIPYELELVSKEGESDEGHRTRHPLGRVPVLEDDDGRMLFESSAICLHAAELAPGTDLIPAAGTLERALTYQWIFFVMTEIEPPAIAVYRARAAADGEDESAVRRVGRGLEAVETALAGRDYILGESFSVADIVVSEVTRMTGRLEVGEPGPGPNLLAYFDRLGERPARERAVTKIAAAGKAS
jgi:glutathione S-transferase